MCLFASQKNAQRQTKEYFTVFFLSHIKFSMESSKQKHSMRGIARENACILLINLTCNVLHFTKGLELKN
jgi:hypothetical protein